MNKIKIYRVELLQLIFSVNDKVEQKRLNY